MSTASRALSNRRSRRLGAQLKTPPVAAETADRGLAPARCDRTEVGPMITARPRDSFQQPLDGIADVSPTTPSDRHYFIPDQHGYYCQACQLPARNKRHVARAA